MIRDNIDSLIKSAMLDREINKTEAYRAIKSAILAWKTAKENIGKTYDEAVEISILRKLAIQYEDTATLCNDGKHDELVNNATECAGFINEFLPAPVTEEKILEVFNSLDFAREKKNMGLFIKEIKKALPAADGKMVSQVVGKNLN